MQVRPLMVPGTHLAMRMGNSWLQPRESRSVMPTLLIISDPVCASYLVSMSYCEFKKPYRVPAGDEIVLSAAYTNRGIPGGHPWHEVCGQLDIPRVTSGV